MHKLSYNHRHLVGLERNNKNIAPPWMFRRKMFFQFGSSAKAGFEESVKNIC